MGSFSSKGSDKQKGILDEVNVATEWDVLKTLREQHNN